MKMSVWEYRVERIVDDTSMQEEEKMLNALGAAGWELVQLLPVAENPKLVDGYFKRRLEG